MGTAGAFPNSSGEGNRMEPVRTVVMSWDAEAGQFVATLLDAKDARKLHDIMEFFAARAPAGKALEPTEPAPAPPTANGQLSAAERISVPLTGGIKQMQRYIVEEVVRRRHGNKAAAARLLGLHRRTLYRLLEGERERKGDGEKGGEEYLAR